MSWSSHAGFCWLQQAILLEIDTSKLGLGAVLSQKQADGWYHLVVYTSQSLTNHEHNYHSMKQEFLALELVIAEQFQEYLLWKPFIVKTNNNLLIHHDYNNLDDTQHWCIVTCMIHI